MRIAVIAANGRLGKVFAEAALSAGHTVRAGVYGASTLKPHPNLTVVPCDATNADDLRSLLYGQDVVVSAIGHVRGSAPTVQTVATECIVAAMQGLNIARFVDVTGTGVRLPGDHVTLFDRLANMLVWLVDSGRIKDGRQHQEVLKGSNLEWTTIRFLKLWDRGVHPYVLRLHGPVGWYVSRADVARAMLEVIEQKRFIGQAPIIGR